MITIAHTLHCRCESILLSDVMSFDGSNVPGNIVAEKMNFPHKEFLFISTSDGNMVIP